MTKRLTIIGIALLLFAGFGYATTKSMSKSSSIKHEGTIQKIDPATHTIVVQVGSDTKTFKFSDKTMWARDSKRVHNTDLKVGDRVTIYSDSKNFARRIEASPHTS